MAKAWRCMRGAGSHTCLRLHVLQWRTTRSDYGLSCTDYIQRSEGMCHRQLCMHPTLHWNCTALHMYSHIQARILGVMEID